MTVLWPAAGEAPVEPPDGGTGINNVSIVLLGTVGRYRFLLAGDVEEAIDPRLIATGLPRLDLLKVAHHGSRTATTQAFVDTVRPRIAIASAGAGNSYGHPTRQTLDRLRAAGAAVYRTDQDGSVQATFTAAGIEVRAEGASAAGAGPATATTAPGDARTDGRGLPLCDPGHGARPGTRAAARSQPATTGPRETEGPGSATTVGYHPVDDGAPARGGRLPPALPRSPDLVRAARARGRGGRRVPGGPDGGRGIALDRRLVEAAALLHDVDKLLPA